MIQKHIWLTGLVQGVGFRAFVKEEAEKHPDVRGFVRNLADGRVEAVFCGEQASVDSLVQACRKGPPGSEVKDVEVKQEGPDPNLNGFQILFS